MSVPGLTGSQYFALLAATSSAGRPRSPAPALHRLRELLHLRVVHVLAQVRADQHQAIGIPDVGRFGRADAGTEGEQEADVARAAALRIRRPA